MGRIIKCAGKYAEKPYMIENMCCRVYSMDELCFYLCENVQMVEKDMFGTDLANWIESELGMKEVSDRLYQLFATGGNISSYVKVIMDASAVVTNDDKRQVLEILSESSGLDAYEKRKRRADYLLSHDRLMLAIHDYESLLADTPKEREELRAQIYHNCGLAKAWLFLFEQAKDDFKEAFKLDGKKEHYFYYAASMRFLYSEAHYVQKISEDEQMSEVTLDLEHKMEEAQRAFEESNLRQCLSVLKEEYRKNTQN